LLINGVTYLISVFALAVIQYRSHHLHTGSPRVSGRAYLAEVGEGWNTVRRNSTVGLALTALGAVWVAGGFLHVAGNQHIQRAAQVPGMERVGVLLCVLGLGSGISTWWLNTGGKRVPRATMLGLGLILAGAGLALFASFTLFAVFAAAAFLIGLAAAPSFMLTETLLQECTEPRTRGRVFSARDFIMRLVFMVGVAAAGALTRAGGTRGALLASAALVAAAGVAILARRGRAAPAPVP
jgi:predicted MFS family arabinose efflux permease